MTNHVAFLKDEIQKLKDQNLYGELPILQSQQQARVEMNNKDVITLSTNNYLGFANHPRLAKAAIAAIEKWGFGTGAVRQIAGTMEIHMEFERMLAEFKKTEAALLFVAGIAANRGTIQAIMGPEDCIISDQLNHGSIIDGVRLTKSSREIYDHCDMDALRQVLQKPEVKSAKRRLIVTDGIFSMDGDAAPLDQIYELAEEFDCITMVDDAHGDGVMGKMGRGTADHFGVEGKIDIDMGTMSKAFGGLGGLIAGRQELKDYLTNRARSFIFTTAHPPCVVAANMEAIKMIQDEPEHHKRLWDNTAYFKKEMESLGFDIGHSVSPITPVMVGESATAQQLSKELFSEGLYVKPIVFPLVAKDAARTRNIVTAQHTKEDLDECLKIYETVGKRMGLI
jgi:glycine C-acetyltransferase